MSENYSDRESVKLALELQELKNTLQQLKEEWRPLNEKLDRAKQAEQAAHEAYLKCVDERDKLNSELVDIKLRGKQLPNQIADLERKLRRSIDQENIALALAQEMQSFKDKCLNASWRKENRNDGYGALPHQIDGAVQLAVVKQGYLFDKRGLGKTLTSLIWADLLDVTKMVIVVPNDVASEYVRQIRKWVPHRSVVPFYQLSPSHRDLWLDTILPTLNEFVLIINYDAWRRDWSIIERIPKLQISTLIFDEAHIVNKPGNLGWKGVFHIRLAPNICPLCSSNNIYYDEEKHGVACQSCGNLGKYSMEGQYKQEEYSKWCSVKNVLPMTGTPILNRPQELYAILRIVEPWNFWSESEFLNSYCWHITGSRWTFKSGGQDMLMRKLGNRVVMRDRKMAGIIIPPQEVIIHELELDENKYPHQVRALRQISDYAQLVLDHEGESVMNMTIFLSVLLRLRQGIEWPNGIKLKEQRDPKTDRLIAPERRLQVYESIKIDWAEELIRQLVDEEERVLVFSHFTDPLDELQTRLLNAGISSVIYDGRCSDHLREAIKADFNPETVDRINGPRWEVLLGNYKSAGTGLNLHDATQTILLGREWNPGKEDQAMGRTDRIGTTRDTTVHIPKVVNSLADDFMDKLLGEKASTVGGFEDAAKLATSLLSTIRKGGLY